MKTASRAPRRRSPSIQRMNGFQAGKDEKSVRMCHTRSAGASISISERSSFSRAPPPYRRRPAALSSAVIFSTACSTSEGLRAPVHTSLPLPKRRTTTFGSSMR